MLRNLSRTVTRICAAEDLGQLDAALTQGALSMGFVSFNLASGKSTRREFMTAPTLSTWSRAELLNYDRDGWFDRDPLLEYASGTGPPLGWQRADWQQRGYHEYHEFLTASGVQSGVTVPLQQGAGRLGAITLLSLRDRPPADVVNMAEIIASTTQARLAALGVANVLDKSQAARFRELSQRQREILKWAAMGKSNAEIAIIMGLTRRGIDYHMGEIARKLNVTSRVQAIVVFAQEHV